MALSPRELGISIRNLLVDPNTGNPTRPEVQLMCTSGSRPEVKVYVEDYKDLQTFSGNTADQVVEALGGVDPIQQRLLERLNGPGRGRGTVVFVITTNEAGEVGIRNLSSQLIF